MIVGLTGKNCAGKGEISEILQKKGFECSSLSDAIRDEADKTVFNGPEGKNQYQRNLE